MILYSWYSWMYAINVIIYVVSSSEFRKVYKIFFEDVFAGFKSLWRKLCFLRTSETSTQAIELMIHWAENLNQQFLAFSCHNFVQILDKLSRLDLSIPKYIWKYNDYNILNQLFEISALPFLCPASLALEKIGRKENWDSSLQSKYLRYFSNISKYLTNMSKYLSNISP